MAKKPLKVEIPDSALRNFSEEEREDIKAQILELFSNMSLEDIEAQSKPVHPVSTGADLVCAACQGPLKAISGTTAMPDGTVSQLWLCPTCDEAFESEPLD